MRGGTAGTRGKRRDASSRDSSPGPGSRSLCEGQASAPCVWDTPAGKLGCRALRMGALCVWGQASAGCSRGRRRGTSGRLPPDPEARGRRRARSLNGSGCESLAFSRHQLGCPCPSSNSRPEPISGVPRKLDPQATRHPGSEATLPAPRHQPLYRDSGPIGPTNCPEFNNQRTSLSSLVQA